jgi:hypothetical protein
MDLTDEQWEVLEPLIPAPPRRAGRQGPTLAGPEERPKRYPLSLAHRRPLARPARTLPALSDLPPPIPALDRGGRARRDPPRFGRGS